MLTNLADIARSAGLKVIETNGWKTRGHGTMGAVKAIVCHHTASAAGSNANSLGTVTNGRPDLAGPLCNYLLARDGTVYTIAGGVAWHAGATIDDSLYSNSHAIGIEAENNGVNEKQSEKQVDAYARLCAAICKAFNIPASRVKGHKEICYPKGRKIDPHGLPGDMAGLRTRVSNILSGKEVDDISAQEVFDYKINDHGWKVPGDGTFRHMMTFIYQVQNRNLNLSTQVEALSKNLTAMAATQKTLVDLLSKQAGMNAGEIGQAVEAAVAKALKENVVHVDVDVNGTDA